jgi:hypothetical protein
MPSESTAETPAQSRVSAIRGTNLLASLAALREEGLSESYWNQLPTAHHEEMRAILASDWVSIDLAHLHYGVLDELVQDKDQQRRLGFASAGISRGAVVRTIARGLKVTARLASLDPVRLGLGRVSWLWSRFAQGGQCVALQEEEGRAVLTIEGLGIGVYPYVRHSFTGSIAASLSEFHQGDVTVDCLPGFTKAKLEFAICW